MADLYVVPMSKAFRQSMDELADSLATTALEFPLFPHMHRLVAPWYCDFGRADPIPNLPPLLPLVTPCCKDPRPWYTGNRRTPNCAARRICVAFSALTLSPSDCAKREAV